MNRYFALFAFFTLTCAVRTRLHESKSEGKCTKLTARYLCKEGSNPVAGDQQCIKKLCADHSIEACCTVAKSFSDDTGVEAPAQTSPTETPTEAPTTEAPTETTTEEAPAELPTTEAPTELDTEEEPMVTGTAAEEDVEEFCTKCALKVEGTQEIIGSGGADTPSLTKPICDSTDAGEECLSKCSFVPEVVTIERDASDGSDETVNCFGKPKEQSEDETMSVDEEAETTTSRAAEASISPEVAEFCALCVDAIEVVYKQVGFVESGDGHQSLTKPICEATDATEECFSKCSFVPKVIDENPETCGENCKLKCVVNAGSGQEFLPVA